MKQNACTMLAWGCALAAVMALVPANQAEAASANVTVQVSFTQAPQLSSLTRAATKRGEVAVRHEVVVGGQSLTASLRRKVLASTIPVTVFHYDYN